MARCNAIWTAICTAALVAEAMADQVLTTSGWDLCGSDATVNVNSFDISYNNDNRTIIFNVVGTSSQAQNVTAVLNVTAYGIPVFSQKFNPCDPDTFVEQLCPLPEGNFEAQGSQQIAAKYAAMIPSIAFQVPDISAQATLGLDSLDDGSQVACIEAEVSNGKTLNTPVVSYVAAGIAGAALILSGASAATGAFSGAAAGSGAGTISPSFTDITGVFQGIAMNSMLSVNYPSIYRNWAQNFAFSAALVPWDQLLTAIDDFRANTGGNLTGDSLAYLRNATLTYPDGSTSKPNSGVLRIKRASVPLMALAARQSDASSDDDGVTGVVNNIKQTVSGIQAFVEQLSVPKSDVFMTALLIVAIVIALIVTGILLVKVVLEFWALFGSFPKSLTGFRKHYWRSIARTITSLILLLYGIWVLYCVFQFTLGDSWAAKTLAGVTLALFTGLLAFFTYKIWSTARKLTAEEGDASRLYEDKSIWVKYSMFYDAYRQNYWWLFVPVIVYTLAKGCVLAGADGHGMVQTVITFILETLMLILLVWSRPFERRNGNIINIVIQTVRVLSTACILVFVEEFGIAQTTQTVTGIVIIALQSTLTGVLAILMAWNAISGVMEMNPHRKRRKELEKMRDGDDLTPLDARNSLLLRHPKRDTEASMYSISSNRTEKQPWLSNSQRYQPVADVEDVSSTTPSGCPTYRSLTPAVTFNEATQNLVQSAAPVGMGGHSRGSSIEPEYYEPPNNYSKAGHRGY